ncbi:IS605 OrfB family transposase [Sphingomonas sp. PP-CE-3G-477]|uniref:RNA-guided endonuclease InsQ/TnpB family protein n=1 Tax=Sphingomonas sp. PP-CE-3G-477 TaxID=2135660 RepID=UPI000D44E3B8|nr:RNA-guided endonuclease TnpB family protein [Sphingomonas sp. PP-CE-3G-477]PTQ64864.1 IS605 OrfB family transposase [Sphingomonas sp. PP-CE-3G-477]
MTPNPNPSPELREARNRLSHHEQMLDAQAGCVPCKLCGGKAVVSDAGEGYGYYIGCENGNKFRLSTGCIIDERRLGGWAYNVMEWWNRLHAQTATLPTDAQVREAMQTAWDDYCDDAKAFPGDLTKLSRGRIMFTAGTWADHTAMHLRAALSPQTLPAPGEVEGDLLATADKAVTFALDLACGYPTPEMDAGTVELRRQARAVNYVWNYCNETQKKAAQARRNWLSLFDLMKLTAGSSKELRLHSQSIQRICRAYDESRRQQKKAWLRWRGKKSLGWVPFNTNYVRFNGTGFVFHGVEYEAMHLRNSIQPGQRFGAGSFNCDANGHWYINLPVGVPCSEPVAGDGVGIDLGLKTLATLSDGDKIEMPRFYRESEAALAKVQRARKTKRARAIHAKARNRRKDFMHKASNDLCRKYGLIAVGDVSPSKLAKTRMAKSVNDAGWSGFKSLIRYKAIMHGRTFLEVNEAYSTQTCSSCGTLPASRPKGIAGLGIRDWECSDCGTVHDRDVNAARNILRIGLDTLAEGAFA